MWADLKKELSMQYSIIPLDAHRTEDFTYLEQGPETPWWLSALCEWSAIEDISQLWNI